MKHLKGFNESLTPDEIDDLKDRMKRIVDDHNILINDKSKTITIEESEVLDSLKTSGKAINKKFDIYLYKENIPQNVSDGITGILNSMNSKNFSKNLWGTFLTKNDLLDTSRNQDFEKTFKELNILINKNLVI